MFTNTWIMESPEPGEKPEMKGEEAVAVQEKVVPATFDVSPIAVDAWEQRVDAGCWISSPGTGLTETDEG